MILGHVPIIGKSGGPAYTPITRVASRGTFAFANAQNIAMTDGPFVDGTSGYLTNDYVLLHLFTAASSGGGIPPATLTSWTTHKRAFTSAGASLTNIATYGRFITGSTFSLPSSATISSNTNTTNRVTAYFWQVFRGLDLTTPVVSSSSVANNGSLNGFPIGSPGIAEVEAGNAVVALFCCSDDTFQNTGMGVYQDQNELLPINLDAGAASTLGSDMFAAVAYSNQAAVQYDLSSGVTGPLANGSDDYSAYLLELKAAA